MGLAVSLHYFPVPLFNLFNSKSDCCGFAGQNHPCVNLNKTLMKLVD